MSKYTIKNATAIYTGGGIYIYYGELVDGLYFRTADEWQSVSICDADTSTEDADHMEFFERHEVDELLEENYVMFFNDIITWIENNKPQGNYNLFELRHRLNRSINEQITTRKRIEELERELQRLKRVEQLETFLNHMSDTFDRYMGDDATNETCTTFYNMDFTISFNGKSIRLDNGAETFQEIESTIQRELDEITE